MRKHFFLIFFLFLIIKPDFAFTQILESFSDTINKKPQPVDLININDAIETTNKKIGKFTKRLSANEFGEKLDSLIVKYSDFLNKEANVLNSYNPNNLSMYFLENEYRAWIGYLSNLDYVNNQVISHLNEVDDDLKEIEWDYNVWKVTYNNLRNLKGVPNEIRIKVRDVLNELRNVKTLYTKRKKKLLLWDNKISDLLLLSNKMILKISTLQLNLRDSLFVANKCPVWKVKVEKQDIFPIGEKVHRALNDNWRIIKNFILQFRFGTIFFFIILITVLFFSIRKKYINKGFDESIPGEKHIRILFEKHWIATYFFLILTLWISVIGKMPLSITFLLAVFMLITIYFIIPEFLGKYGINTIILITVIYFFNEFEILIWYFGKFSRYYLLFESTVGILITYYFGTNRLKKPQKSNSPQFKIYSYYLSLFLLSLYSISLITNIFGFVNLTVIILKIAVQTAIILLLIFSVQKVLKIFVNAICNLGRADKNSALKGYWDKIENISKKVIDIVAIFYGLKLILGMMELYRTLYQYIVDILTSELVVGNISISLGGILGMILIIILSYYFAKSVEVLFVNNKIVKKKLSAGLAFAIATSFKYLLLLSGVIFGMAYAGIDIGKFSLFTGALGVGIGFGLQNIVNNFISGLILLYERPVEVGDTIEVGDLLGVVKKIGVRASNVRTYDGAEVVVPNGNIISNDLINWTLSDDKKRLEIKIGVAYGSDVNKVLKVLQKVAVNNELVFPDPPPKVLFEEFGDSSLNFRVLCWIPYESGLTARSELSIAIYNAFAENGIEIPFPQIDLHVKDINSGNKTEKPDVVMPKAPDNSPKVVNDNKGEIEKEFNTGNDNPKDFDK